jgi:glutamyl-tRNA reductase
VARELVVFGISHHRTPVAVRERMASTAERVSDDLKRLLDEEVISEGVLLSTCNRVELVAVTDEPHKTREHVLGYFEHRASPEPVIDYVYEHAGSAAVKHLFRVASGLDSMVLGEPQILGQVKDAVALAQRVGSMGGMLGRCFDRTFSVAKRVRTETEIASGNVSVSSIACELAEKIFSDLAGRKVLLVGAGKMSEVAARSLKARGASLTVINRSAERAAELAAACGGEARPLEALATELAAADVAIASTSKDGFVITYELMQGVAKMRKFRPLFMIDIAVPRDIDPRVESIRNVFCTTWMISSGFRRRTSPRASKRPPRPSGSSPMRSATTASGCASSSSRRRSSRCASACARSCCGRSKRPCPASARSIRRRSKRSTRCARRSSASCCTSR